MQKLFRPVLDKMIEQQVNNTQLAVLLHIGKYQDDYGVVVGVHNKDVCDATGICTQSFYNALDGLKSKQIIAVSSSHHGDWDIKIIGNEDKYAIAKKRGITLDKKPSYISLHHQIFEDEKFKLIKATKKNPKFKPMKVNARLLAMLLLFYVGSNEKIKKNKQSITSFWSKGPLKGCYSIHNKRFFDDYCKLLKIEKTTLQKYKTELKEFFYFKLRGGIYYIISKDNVFTDNEDTRPPWSTDDELLIRNLAHVALRRKPLLKRKNPLITPIEIAENIKDFLRDQLRKPNIVKCFLSAFKYLDAEDEINYLFLHQRLQKELAR